MRWCALTVLLGGLCALAGGRPRLARRLLPPAPLAARSPPAARKLPEAAGTGRTLGSSKPPGAQQACAVDGILLYQGAVWSPRPCVVCACEGGAALCEQTQCPALGCRGARVPAGDCCPVCPVGRGPGGSRTEGAGPRSEGRSRGGGASPPVAGETPGGGGRGEGRPGVPAAGRCPGEEGGAEGPQGGRAEGGSGHQEEGSERQEGGSGLQEGGSERQRGGSGWPEGGSGHQEVGSGHQEGGNGHQEGGSGRQRAGSGCQETGSGRQETGSGRQEGGSGSQGGGSWRQETGSGRQKAGSGRQEGGSGSQEEGSWRQETGSRCQEGGAGLKKKEVGVKKQEVGVKKQEVSLKNQEVGVKKQEVGVKKQDVGVKPEGAHQKPRADVKELDAGLKKPEPLPQSPEVRQKKRGSRLRKGGAGGKGAGAGGVPGRRQAAAGGVGGRKGTGKGRQGAGAGRRPGPTGTPFPFPPELLPPPESESGIPSLPSGCILAERAIACPGNRLSAIPRLQDPALHTLYLADNDITSIASEDLSGLPNIRWLDLSLNRIGDEGMDPEAFSNLTRLQRLNLDGNRLSKIPLLPPSLEELKLNDNRLATLDRNSFRGLSRLLTLDLEGNGLHDGTLHPSSLRPLRRLVYLRLGRNRFRALPAGLPPSLRELYLESNLIEEIPGGLLNNTTNLTILILQNNSLQENRISPQAWFHLRSLETLDLSHNRMVHIPSFLPTGLKQLLLHHNQIERIPGYVFAHLKPGLEFLHLSYNNLQNDGIHAVSFLGVYHSLQELLLDHNLLRAVPRGLLKLRVLQALSLSDNHIRHIPMDSICDTRIAEDSSLLSVRLENNLIDRRQIPPTAFSCIRSYHSLVLQPQRFKD